MNNKIAKELVKIAKNLNADSVQDQLEGLIDKTSLEHIVILLTNICHEKADHVRTNWQDERLAKSWEKDAKTLDSISGKIINS